MSHICEVMTSWVMDQQLQQLRSHRDFDLRPFTTKVKSVRVEVKVLTKFVENYGVAYYCTYVSSTKTLKETTLSPESRVNFFSRLCHHRWVWLQSLWPQPSETLGFRGETIVTLLNQRAKNWLVFCFIQRDVHRWSTAMGFITELQLL